jgi:putative nucleotidyltransferase with HDIG domain
MAAVAKMARKEGPHKGWFRETLEKLRSRLTWWDLLFGTGATLLIATLLLGFGFQTLPSYKAGEIAAQEVRAPLDVTYEDLEATASLRDAARDRAPSVYEFDADRIASLESEISRAFTAGRRLLSDQGVPPQIDLEGTQLPPTLNSLEGEVGKTIPLRFLPLLVAHRFGADLEKKILQVLDTVLRGGVVADGEAFRQDLKRGIVLRDPTALVERPLREFSGVRSLEAAKECVRQYQMEFSEFPPASRAELLALLDSQIITTLIFNAAETTARREAAAARVRPIQVQLKKGKVIIRAGEQVTARAMADLAILRHMQRPRFILSQLLGLFFFVASLLYALWRYLVHYQNRHRKIRNHAVLVVLVIMLAAIVVRLLTAAADILSERVSLVFLQDPFNLYSAIPFSFAALLVTLLIDTNVGLIVSMMAGVITGLFYGDIYLAVYALLGSLAGIYGIRQYKERSALFKSGLTIGVVNAFALLGIHLLKQDTFVFFQLVSKAALGIVSGMFAAALSSILLPALESLFKVTTDIRLLELSNLNSPVLRRLSVEAPGTYHHSLMVGTLAEAAAEAIGANPLLVRVAAYYHDLGKVLRPEYFMENQAFGVNKHEALTPSLSCLILASHVKSGLELARQAGLTETIRQMIAEHHGTRVMTFFYQKAKESAGVDDREVREGDFRYPGPKPQSKEAAVLMMADSVEAASRTLSNPSATQIQGMIERLIEDILADSQLDQCDITIREVRLAKESLFKVLSGIHHRRIDYPGYDFKLLAENSDKAQLRDSGNFQAKAI